MVLDEGAMDLQFAIYKQYLQDSKNPFRGGNQDDLRAILEALSPHTNPNSLQVQQMTSKQALLPVLMSCASFLLAEQAVTAYMENPLAALIDQQQPPAGDTTFSSDFPSADSVEEHTGQCLTFFSQHGAAWVLGANFGRITKRLHAAQIAAWYEEAAAVAATVRAEALKLLETLDSTGDGSSTHLQEWVEVLLLNGAAGVERLASTHGESSFGSDMGEDPPSYEDDNDMNEDQESDSIEDGGIWSESTVEATARFMCAMLPSIAGDHATALISLRRFPVTHRLSRAMWTGENETAHQVSEDGTTSPSLPTLLNQSEPSKFCREGGLLPSTLYQSLCQVFGRDAAYWRESDYVNRGYFSFFCDIPPKNTPPSNLIEDVVVNYLLPLAKRHLTVDEASQLCGYEWWVVSKPNSDDLGTNLHFEHDYALRDLYQKKLRPFLSSCLYLEGHTFQSGASVIVDQNQDSNKDAEYGWRSSPIENSYLVFAGDLLRGTMPANSRPTPEPSASPSSADLDAAKDIEDSASDRPPEIVGELLPEKEKTIAKLPAAFVTTITNSQLLNMADLWKAPTGKARLQKCDSDSSEAGHTLTLMVAFWGHRIPDVLKNNESSELLPYTPCGPLPTNTAKHTWVRDIQVGYIVPSASMSSPAQQLPNRGKRQAPLELGQIRESKLRRIGPAWEAVDKPDEFSIHSTRSADFLPQLKIPTGFSNRFFLQSTGETGSIASATARDDGESSIRTNESTSK